MAADRLGLGCTYLRLFMKTVSHDRLRDEGHDFAHMRIVDAQYRHAIKRQALREFDEGLLEPGEIVTVCFHMIRIDIRDDFNHRQQIQE